MLYTLKLCCTAVFPITSALECQASFDFCLGIPISPSLTRREPSLISCNIPTEALAIAGSVLSLCCSLCIFHLSLSCSLVLILLDQYTEKSGTGRSPACFHGDRARARVRARMRECVSFGTFLGTALVFLGNEGRSWILFVDMGLHWIGVCV